MRDRLAERVDLLLGVGGVHKAVLLPLGLGHYHRAALRVEARVRLQLEPCLLKELDDLEGDGGGAGDARRVDARRVDELRLGGALLENPVATAGLGTRTGEGVERVVGVEGGYEAAAALQEGYSRG